ncbi:MAG: helix-turn-helix transcriptional regulator [Bacteroidetes bacterium]|nr:helix-turn-helix transcriptional regulator [Bacteroidota bacterium]
MLIFVRCYEHAPIVLNYRTQESKMRVNEKPSKSKVIGHPRLPNAADDEALIERLGRVFGMIFRTRADASVIVGVTTGQISNYVKGSFLPSIAVFYRLVHLGISADWLLTESGTMFTNNEAGDRLYKMVQRGEKLTIDDHFASYFASQQSRTEVAPATLPMNASEPIGLFGATA